MAKTSKRTKKLTGESRSAPRPGESVIQQIQQQQGCANKDRLVDHEEWVGRMYGRDRP